MPACSHCVIAWRFRFISLFLCNEICGENTFVIFLQMNKDPFFFIAFSLFLALIIVFFYIFASVFNSPAIHTTYTCRHSEIIFHIHSFLCDFFFLLFWISKRIFLCIFIHCSAIEKKTRAGNWMREFSFRLDFFRISVLWIGGKQNFFVYQQGTVSFLRLGLWGIKSFFSLRKILSCFQLTGVFYLWWFQILTKRSSSVKASRLLLNWNNGFHRVCFSFFSFNI